ncbi:MAG: hypothetical protein OQJ76_05775, partial [Rhodospirillales bacterium]|nr:hypothetical protein [Rhodospirillales bacterium]
MRKRIISRSIFTVLAVTFSFVISACKHSDYGAGPISLSDNVQASLIQYKKLDFPIYFAVSTDGQSAGW